MSMLSSRTMQSMRLARQFPAARQQLIKPKAGNAIRRSSGHGSGPWGANSEHLPFNLNDTRRRTAVKCVIYMGTGFSIPFAAIWWHWNRPGGLSAAA